MKHQHSLNRIFAPATLASLCFLASCSTQTQDQIDIAVDSETQTEANGSAGETQGDLDISVTLADYDAIMQHVSQQKGKIVVLDLWSTSCFPCMEEFPKLVALSKSHAETVACISVNLDYIGLKRQSAESYSAAVEEFLQSVSADITNFLASESDEKIRGKFEVYSIPAILVFDQSGQLAARLTDSTTGEDGLSYEADVIPLVDKLLSSEP